MIKYAEKGTHDCADLLARFEELVRLEEKMCLFPGVFPMGRKKIEELNFLRKELCTLLRVVCTEIDGED